MLASNFLKMVISAWLLNVLITSNPYRKWTARTQCLMLLGFADFLVLRLGDVPHEEGNSERWNGHDGETDPVKEVR